nr:uncharacterized protein LOC109183154 [Ipomoea batatas]
MTGPRNGCSAALPDRQDVGREHDPQGAVSPSNAPNKIGADALSGVKRAHSTPPEKTRVVDDPGKPRKGAIQDKILGRERGTTEIGGHNSLGMPRALPPWASRPPPRVATTVPLTPLNARPSEILAYVEECQVVKIPESHPRNFQGKIARGFVASTAGTGTTQMNARPGGRK